ncbi:MAG: NUDIX domain-containing protein, partial [Desulfofustis sp.]|nr:NUDIX domain-containing protein [Desulfofustis sp.]
MNYGTVSNQFSSSKAQPEAAVGIIVCSRPEESLLLIKRNENRYDPWSGHYAFPGGRKEIVDTTIYQTCIREVREETGIILEPESLQQTCAPARAGRNVKAPILVQPYVFWLPAQPAITIEEKEIARHVWLAVDDFKDLNNHRMAEPQPGMIRPVFPL